MLRATTLSLSSLVLLAGQFTSRISFYQMMTPIVISAPRSQPPIQALISVLQGTKQSPQLAQINLNNSENAQQRSIYIGDDNLFLNQMVFSKSEISRLIQDDFRRQMQSQIALQASPSNSWPELRPEGRPDADVQAPDIRSLSREAQYRYQHAEQTGLTSQSEEIVGESYRAKLQQILKDTPLAQTEGQIAWSGKLEIKGGLAVTPDTHLEVQHIRDGIIQDVAQVNLSSGTYAFRERPRGGTIVARLKNKTGHIRGEVRKTLLAEELGGGMNVADFSPSSASVAPDLNVEPQPGFVAVAHSLNSQKMKINATILRGEHEMQGHTGELLQFDQVESGSSTEIMISAPEHQSTRALLVAGKQVDIPILPLKWIRLLRDVVLDGEHENVSEKSGLIIGRVSRNGKGIAGMKLRLDQYPNMRPVYLNELFLPSKNMKATDRSGYFVFLDAPEGHVDILAENNRGEPMVIQGFVAAQEMTTYLELATTDKTNRTVLRSYDALTGEPQKASVEFPAQDPPLELNGEAKQVMASIDQWQETYVRPENPTYADAFYQYNQAEDHIHFPLMTKAWLNNFLVEMDVVPQGSVLGVDGAGASGSVNPAPTPLATRANRTIGFVTDEEFTVYIAGHPELKAIYFDAKGKRLQSSRGQAGGGFAVVGLPEGSQQIIVIKENSQNLHSRIIHVTEGKNSVLFF